MKKRMKKVATLCLAGVTAMSTVGVTGSAVFAKGDTNYDVDNMDFENVELRVAFRFNNGSDTDGQAKWYYKALDEFNKENEGKIHVTDESISTESDYEEKFLKWVYVFFMIGVMVPVHCTLIPINNIATALNAKNNLFFLILIYVAFGMSQAIFLYTGFMDGISRNLDEAAIIDGCNNWQLLWKILFPVCKPIIATEAIFVFIYGYSELVFSMILMTDTKYFTVSRAMLNFSSAHTQEIGSQFAYVVMSVIPMLIIYIVFHKQIEKGMLSGAIKG